MVKVLFTALSRWTKIEEDGIICSDSSWEVLGGSSSTSEGHAGQLILFLLLFNSSIVSSK